MNTLEERFKKTWDNARLEKNPARSHAIMFDFIHSELEAQKKDLREKVEGMRPQIIDSISMMHGVDAADQIVDDILSLLKEEKSEKDNLFFI